MKKILASLLSLIMLLGAASPALAFNFNIFKVKGQNVVSTGSGETTGSWKLTRATPGNPVTLEGQGEVKASGRGRVRYVVTEGTVKLIGRGVVAVKGGEVKAKGFGGKKQIGDYTYYYGTGQIEVNGSNYEVSGWGGGVWWKKLNTSAQGKGKVTFRGWWTIKYRGNNTTQAHLEAVSVPTELQSEAGPDANLN